VGDQGVFGLEDLFSISTQNSVVSGYHLWFAENNITLYINPGSTVGDLAPGGTGDIVHAYQTHFTFGSLYASSLTNVYLYDCLVDDSTIVYYVGNLNAERTNFTNTITSVGNTYFADCNYNQGLVTLQPGSQHFIVDIIQPMNGATFNASQNVSVFATVQAFSAGFVPITPMPTATIAVADSNGNIVGSAFITNPSNGGIIGRYLTPMYGGTYTVLLNFGTNTAASRRTINIVGPSPPNTSTSSATSSTTSSATSSAASSTGSSTSASATSAMVSTTTSATTSSDGSVCKPTIVSLITVLFAIMLMI